MHSILRLTALCAMAAMLGGLSAPSATAQQRLPLTQGQSMQRDVRYVSASGGHYLIFQSDGNLVVYTTAGQYVWGLDQTPADFSRVASVAVQADGNLVAHDASGGWVWSALDADPSPGSRVRISARGALQLVSPDRRIRWTSNQSLPADPADDAADDDAPAVDAPDAGASSADDTRVSRRCDPIPGWSQCRRLTTPDIQIYGTSNVSASAMRVVAGIYSDLMSRLRPAYPASRFDGFRVYITNGETQQQLDALPEIAVFAPDPTGSNSKNWVRGGANRDYLWISEEMICKTGVPARGTADTTTRTFDQVVHEFSHSIADRYDLGGRINGMYSDAQHREFPRYERFPWVVQRHFSTPSGENSADEQRFMNELFTGPTSFSCTDYRP